MENGGCLFRLFFFRVYCGWCQSFDLLQIMVLKHSPDRYFLSIHLNVECDEKKIKIKLTKIMSCVRGGYVADLALYWIHCREFHLGFFRVSSSKADTR